jgi:epoxide hydrolase-like predicted phosphatase
MIKAIIFDFFGVICSDEYWNFVKEDKDLDSGFGRLADDVNLGKISWQDYVETIAKRTSQDIQTVAEMFDKQKVNPQVLAFAQSLKKRYKVALLTNASNDQFKPLVERFQLNKIFSEIVISSELGIAKPDPRIFQYTLSKLKVPAQEAVFIDDSSRHIYVAKDLGFNTILYYDFGQMKAELARMLTDSAGTDN